MTIYVFTWIALDVYFMLLFVLLVGQQMLGDRHNSGYAYSLRSTFPMPCVTSRTIDSPSVVS